MTDSKGKRRCPTLVLSRKCNEEVVATASNGETITVRVVELRGDKVRLGFVAPSSVRLHRREVQDAIDAGEPDRKADVRLKEGWPFGGANVKRGPPP